MTNNKLIRMAIDAGFHVYEGAFPFEPSEDKFLGFERNLERFAALVAAHEREKWEQALPIAMDAMMLQEREECAKVCEGLGWGNNPDVNPNAGTTCAAAIRSRSSEH